MPAAATRVANLAPIHPILSTPEPRAHQAGARLKRRGGTPRGVP